MHLLREGEFAVASTFIEEANRNPPFTTKPNSRGNVTNDNELFSVTPKQLNQSQRTNYYQDSQQQHDYKGLTSSQHEAWEQDFAHGTERSESLQRQFAEMYHILHELRQRHNLGPAIKWARAHSVELESRGSNLEFELCRLQFITLFLGISSVSHDPNPSESDPSPMNIDNPTASSETTSPYSSLTYEGPLRAWAYARSEFGSFQARYAREIQELIGAMAFWQNMADSPYRHLFGRGGAAWDEVADSFAREFCSLLGLSAKSPLYSATTAGAIALPRIMKMQSIMKEKRTEWTTHHELPVSS